MAFDDLTTNQKNVLIELIENLSTGQFESEFFSLATLGKGQFFQLFGIGEAEDKEMAGYTQTDLQALSNEGYLTLVQRDRNTFAASLKPRAHEQYKLHKDPLNLFTDMAELTQARKPKLDIFISHSSKDKAIAEALITLLRDALSIPAHRIRCTSVDGYRLPAGIRTDEQLRREVRESRVFIGVVTTNSIESAYVLFELGARWGAELHLVPLLASGADTGTLRGPLSSLNALSCDSPAQLHQLISDVAEELGISTSQPAAYQKHIEVLVELSRHGGVRYQDREIDAKDLPTPSPSQREQFSEHDRRLFDRFLNEFPSQGKSATFLRDHDIGASFHENALTEIYEFLRLWKDAEHEFNNPEIEDKRRRLLEALEKFSRELSQYAHTTHREGRLSIDSNYLNETGEFFAIQEKLNELATIAYHAHQDLIREVRKHL